jgi:MFS family permease
VIEGGLIALGALLAALSVAGPISRLLQGAGSPGGLDLTAVTSLLAIVVVIAFFAGIAYGLVASPSQTQLQEDLPADVRGRVFGVLNMLVSVASFLPIIIVGPISDLVGTTTVILVVALSVLAAGLASLLTRGPLLASDSRPAADPRAVDPIAAALGADRPTWTDGVEVEIDTTRELIVTPGTPVGLVTPGTPTGLEPTGVEPTGLERAGPSDPTDRD